MKKILSLLLIVSMIVCMLVVLTGCGKKKEEKNAEKEEVVENTENNSESNAIEEPKEEINSDTNSSTSATEVDTAKNNEETIDMPENVRIYLYQDYGNNQGVYFDVIKIGNNALRTQVSTTGANRVIQNNKGYHYFKYKGDNKWDLYYKNDTKDWYLYTPDVTLDQFNSFMNLNYVRNVAPEEEWKEHEAINVDGIGNVDTIHVVRTDGSEDRLIDEWYSTELKRNIKTYVQYTKVASEILTYDTSVTSFGIDVP